MNITALNERTGLAQDSIPLYAQLEKLLNELRQKELPDPVIVQVNKHIEELNAYSSQDREFKKRVKKKQTEILKLVEKELKLVPRNHYRNLWLALGMSAFGLPLGVALGVSIGNMGLMALGLPVGMAVGVSVGTALDKKALEEKRQLNIEIKY